ncbi:MAG: thiamine phosphate synthase, partial [Muribaculaceae bacterium]|nr:thiamine phosphate synthase [Muribaculaceae bacterium]
MLQFITSSLGPLPQVEQAVKAVEGGCSWIELAPGESLAATAEALVERLKGQDVFLVLPDDADLADRLRVHGVVLSSPEPKTVAETRERLGAHAVIGVRVSSAQEAVDLRAIDIDYIIYGGPAD